MHLNRDLHGAVGGKEGGSPVPVKRDLGIGIIMDNNQLVVAGKVDRFLEETLDRPPHNTTAALRDDRDAGHKPWLGY